MGIEKKSSSKSKKLKLTKKSIFSRKIALVFAVVFAAIGTYTLLQTDAATRDAFNRPFAANSIWNTPIGSNAVYRDASIPQTKNAGFDGAYFKKLSPSDPVRAHLTGGTWRDRCSGTKDTGNRLNLPNGFLIPDAYLRDNGSWSTPNNGWEFLLADGQTLYTSGAGARCSGTGPIYGHNGVQRVDINGDGLRGGHGASRLPRIGGAVRKGELSGSEPINHVLSLVLYTKYAYSDNKQTKESTYRWPASGSDSFALDKTKTDRYIGTNSDVKIGSLLALHPSLTYADLNITSKEGKKLFDALQNWGGYWTDDSAWDSSNFAIDEEAMGTFTWNDTQKKEMTRMIDAISVVTNNGPNNIGGGGTPRVPKHPDFRGGTTDPAPTPTPDPAPDPDTTGDTYILPADNLITPRIATASSQISDVFTPDKAIDNDEQTNESRWTSARQDNEWLELDLEGAEYIDRLAILWAGDTTKDYEIRTSTDGVNFTVVATGSTDGQQFFYSQNDLSGTQASHIRIYGLTRWNENFGNSIREVGVYIGEAPVITDPTPTPDPTPDPTPTPDPAPESTPSLPQESGFTQGVSISGSSTVGGDFTADKAADGIVNDDKSRWTSSRDDGQTLTIDLGSEKLVDKVATVFAKDTTNGYRIELAGEDQVYQEVANGNTVSGIATLQEDMFTATNARYVRMVGVSRWNNNFGHSVFEFGVYEADAPEDTTAPSVTITSPATGSQIVGTTTITAAASDDVAVASVSFYVNSSLIGAVTSAPYELQWSSISLSDGNHTLTARATDTAGNTATTAGRVVTVNNIPEPTPDPDPVPTPDTPPPRLTADINQDGVVNNGDLIRVLSNWRRVGNNNSSDINQDGIVDNGDLIRVLSNWMRRVEDL